MEKIQTKIIKIGNSKGVRIPKHMLDRLDMTDDIELVVDDETQQIHIRPLKSVRKGWGESFQKMHERKEDDLIIDDALDLNFDLENWEW